MRYQENKRARLSHALDKEVYQVVRSIFESNSQLKNQNPILSVPSIYDKIKRSNSSLNRKNKKLLEDSIERVLCVLQDDQNQSDDSDLLQDEASSPIPSRPSNDVNKSIVGMWAKADQVSPSAKISESSVPTVRGTVQVENSKGSKRSAEEVVTVKRRKTKASNDRSPPSHLSLADLGGVDPIIRQLEDLLVLPLLQPDIFQASKIQPPRGVLLHGPPGCGKTMLANAFAAEIGVPFIALSAPSIVSGMSGESEKALREHFEEAKRVAPCLVFIDEIDAITPKRESAQREMEKRIVAQLLTCMDDLALEKTGGKAVIVIAATNRPDSLDPALRRGGRFDKEINMSVPSEPVRELILNALTRQMRVASDVDTKQLAKSTAGFVGADLNDLVSTAGAMAIKSLLADMKAKVAEMEVESDGNVTRQLMELRKLIKQAKEPDFELVAAVSVTHADFMAALPKIQPSSKREGFTTVPETTWADIGALDAVREELTIAVVEPVRHPERYTRVGITPPSGVLLWGPPGCGKTLLAKAVANESKANFISIKGPELLNKYVGESERAVRQVFVRARSSVPCVIFFDELDAIVPRRDDALSESSARVVNTLLTELDGLGSSEGIFVVGATNRPDIIDPAMLRPGRLETLLYVGLPSADERVDILRTLVRKVGIDFGAQLEGIARDCEGFSGADLGGLVRRAGYRAIKRNDGLLLEDFLSARTLVKPSVVDQKKYDRLRASWGARI